MTTKGYLVLGLPVRDRDRNTDPCEEVVTEGDLAHCMSYVTVQMRSHEVTRIVKIEQVHPERDYEGPGAEPGLSAAEVMAELDEVGTGDD